MDDFLIWWDSYGWWAHAGMLYGGFGAVYVCTGWASALLRRTLLGAIASVLDALVVAILPFYFLAACIYLLWTGAIALWATVSGMFS